MKISRWFIPASLGFALSLGQGSATAPAPTINDGQMMEASLADSLEENENCTVSDPFESDSYGDLKITCPAGHRMGSEENPCPDGETSSCCSCGDGSYQLNYSTCDKCIRHTVCSEYDIVGDPFRDSVCKATEQPDLALPDKSTTIKTASSLTTTTAESHTKTPDGSTKVALPTRDTGQDEKFTIHWPWSIVVFVLLLAVAVILLLLIVWAVVKLFMKWHRKHVRGYNLPPLSNDGVQLNDLPQQPQGNGHIPGHSAAGAIGMDANEMKAEDES